MLESKVQNYCLTHILSRDYNIEDLTDFWGSLLGTALSNLDGESRHHVMSSLLDMLSSILKSIQENTSSNADSPHSQRSSDDVKQCTDDDALQSSEEAELLPTTLPTAWM